jgi:hypothetical protein
MLSFCNILDLKITHLEKSFNQYSDLITDNLVVAWHSKAKTFKLLHKLGVFYKRKFPKLTSKMQVSFVNETPVLHLKFAVHLCQINTPMFIKLKRLQGQGRCVQ